MRRFSLSQAFLSFCSLSRGSPEPGRGLTFVLAKATGFCSCKAKLLCLYSTGLLAACIQLFRISGSSERTRANRTALLTVQKYIVVETLPKPGSRSITASHPYPPAWFPSSFLPVLLNLYATNPFTRRMLWEIRFLPKLIPNRIHNLAHYSFRRTLLL
ncbi:hypothetical protein VFPPC_18000 [Pochonia chlamydosporia 170]|uniref:Uncharacterized protein n=1 Tax=Pochonia chlamydosporia 170 TaxID=1380566 RepID=A0A219ARD6_METCM|nr:hypothetical protein VFPPC_18000 [Pochonia chlamydosporia 170]OWT42745.1 hypothetical protein VFPPC_18000 [Pochonia chlamydosporia 170]